MGENGIPEPIYRLAKQIKALQKEACQQLPRQSKGLTKPFFARLTINSIDIDS